MAIADDDWQAMISCTEPEEIPERKSRIMATAHCRRRVPTGAAN